jgi:methylphosphotriester-DNA--protein-cysteine methyltransferase
LIHWDTTSAPVRLNEEVAALVFPACWLDQLLRMLRIEPVKMKSSASAMAHRLFIHLRTLNRQLKAQGMEFKTLADAVRFAVAR